MDRKIYYPYIPFLAPQIDNQYINNKKYSGVNTSGHMVNIHLTHGEQEV